MKIRKVKIFQTYFVFSKSQIVFWSWEGIWVISPTRVNFCSFWVGLGYLLWFLVVLSFIYLLILICGNFTIGKLFDFISAHFCLNGSLYFSLKNLMCGKSFFELRQKSTDEKWLETKYAYTSRSNSKVNQKHYLVPGE